MVRVEARDAPTPDASMEDGSRPNRRRNPRVSVDLPLVFQLDGAPLRTGRAVSYSESGIFVATTAPPPRGTWVIVRLLLSGEVFELEALVVRVVPELGPGGTAGFGAEFVVLPQSVKSGFVRLLASAHIAPTGSI